MVFQSISSSEVIFFWSICFSGSNATLLIYDAFLKCQHWLLNWICTWLVFLSIISLSYTNPQYSLLILHTAAWYPRKTAVWLCTKAVFHVHIDLVTCLKDKLVHWAPQVLDNKTGLLCIKHCHFLVHCHFWVLFRSMPCTDPIWCWYFKKHLVTSCCIVLAITHRLAISDYFFFFQHCAEELSWSQRRSPLSIEISCFGTDSLLHFSWFRQYPWSLSCSTWQLWIRIIICPWRFLEQEKQLKNTTSC